MGKQWGQQAHSQFTTLGKDSRKYGQTQDDLEPVVNAALNQDGVKQNDIPQQLLDKMHGKIRMYGKTQGDLDNTSYSKHDAWPTPLTEAEYNFLDNKTRLSARDKGTSNPYFLRTAQTVLGVGAAAGAYFATQGVKNACFGNDIVSNAVGNSD